MASRLLKARLVDGLSPLHYPVVDGASVPRPSSGKARGPPVRLWLRYGVIGRWRGPPPGAHWPGPYPR